MLYQFILIVQTRNTVSKEEDMKKMKYQVWMGFRNYTGKVDSWELIAEFCSRNRADDYKVICEGDGFDGEYKVVEK